MRLSPALLAVVCAFVLVGSAGAASSSVTADPRVVTLGDLFNVTICGLSASAGGYYEIECTDEEALEAAARRQVPVGDYVDAEHDGRSDQRQAEDAQRVARARQAAVARALLALGLLNLAALLGRGVVASALVALYLYAAMLALEPILVYALTSPTLSRSSLLANNAVALKERIGSVLRFVGAVAWLYLTLGAVGLRSAAIESLRALLRTGVSVGALSLSVGAVLAFVGAIVHSQSTRQLESSIARSKGSALAIGIRELPNSGDRNHAMDRHSGRKAA